MKTPMMIATMQKAPHLLRMSRTLHSPRQLGIKLRELLVNPAGLN